MKEVKSKYQCPKCKINIPFGFTKSERIHDMAKKRYNLNMNKDWEIERCPKCFRQYAREIKK